MEVVGNVKIEIISDNDIEQLEKMRALLVEIEQLKEQIGANYMDEENRYEEERRKHPCCQRYCKLFRIF